MTYQLKQSSTASLSLELVADEDNADALRRQLILAPAIQEEPVQDIPPAPVTPLDPDHMIHHENDIDIITDIDTDPYLTMTSATSSTKTAIYSTGTT